MTANNIKTGADRNEEDTMPRTPAVILATLATLSAGAAAAHPRFVESTPVRGAKLTAAPKEVRVTFSEGVDPRESEFELFDAAGKSLPAGALRGDPKNPRAIVMSMPRKLAPGAYQVRWRVAAAGHASTPGRLSFEVTR